jgi:hypothetical protein
LTLTDFSREFRQMAWKTKAWQIAAFVVTLVATVLAGGAGDSWG